MAVEITYYPYSHEICHHYYDDGGCTFCGFHSMKRCISKTPVSDEEQIAHYDAFLDGQLEKYDHIDKLSVAVNGSWFTQLPKALRKHIYTSIEENNIPLLKYECRASLFDMGRAFEELDIMYKKRYKDRDEMERDLEIAIEDLQESFSEISPHHRINLGLEVANDNDLKIMNKGCTLDEYVYASKYIHEKGAQVGANILLAPPEIENPIEKAFETVKFAVEEMEADEIFVMPCIPMRGSKANKLWKNGEWNPMSATASSEIYRIFKEAYPERDFKYLNIGVHNFHSKVGQFKRDHPWTDEEKFEIRKQVRAIGREYFPDINPNPKKK